MVSSPLLEAILLPFVEQICFRASQIHNLRTAISLQRKRATARQWTLQWLRDGSEMYDNWHLSPGWYTLYSSRRQTLPALRRWRSVPGRSHSCTRRRYGPACMASRKNHRWHTCHRLKRGKRYRYSVGVMFFRPPWINAAHTVIQFEIKEYWTRPQE